MKTLLILRHAKSSWNNAHLADHDRPLSDRGHHDAPRMGRLLRRESLVPGLILSSSAERAMATAEAVAEASGYEHDIEASRALYMAGSDTYLEILRRLPDEQNCVMVVGHNPGMEELLYQLTELGEFLPTATLARVDLPIDRWSELNEETGGRLINLWRPRDVTNL